MENFENTQKMLLSLLAHNLFSAPLVHIPDVDWDEVLNESVMQSVFLLAFQNHKELPLDAETRMKLNNRLMPYLAKNISCFQDHTYLHSLLDSNGITYCILKGASSAHYYPDPLLRAMGDVDFFVPSNDLEKAKEVLTSVGFECSGTNHKYHIVFKKDKMHCEMHFAPIDLPKGKMGKIFMDYWSEICETSVFVKDDLAEFRMPSPFLHGFVLLTHFRSHLLFEGIGLRHICDWVIFANSFSNDEFVNVFEDKLKKVGMWKLAQIICLIAVDYMGMPYCEWMGEDHNTAKELLLDILKSGNFGRKDRQRAYEGFFISDGAADACKNNRIIQAFKSLNGLVDSYWKGAEKFPLLYPIGWMYFSVRFLVRLVLGKRKVDVFDAYSESKKRQELYEKLNILKPE